MTMTAAPSIDYLVERYEVADSGCWLWTGSIDADGYARVKNGRPAHRVIYLEVVGQIPDGLVLDHLCRVRHCVNPDHLEPVTPEENTRRGDNFYAVNAAKTHCLRGHPFDAANTYLYARGGSLRRYCRACIDIRQRARRAAKGA